MTRTADHPQFRCEVCGHRFDWSPELAGQTVTCQCLEPVHVPDQPDNGDYDLAPVRVQPLKPAEVAALAAAAATPVVGYQRPTDAAIDERYSEANPLIASRWKDLILPISIVVIGTFAQFIWRYRLGGSPTQILQYVGASFLKDVVVMLVGIVLAAQALGVTFGPVPTAILKLGAISLAPAGLLAMAGAIFAGGAAPMILAWLAGFAVYYYLFWYLFELEMDDVWQTVLIVFGIRMVGNLFFALAFR